QEQLATASHADSQNDNQTSNGSSSVATIDQSGSQQTQENSGAQDDTRPETGINRPVQTETLVCDYTGFGEDTNNLDELLQNCKDKFSNANTFCRAGGSED